MAKKIEMISLEGFASHIYHAVENVFVFFEANMYKEVKDSLKDLKEFVELNYNEVCDWGYECSYLPYRTTNAAMDKKILEEILRLSEDFINEGSDGKKQILSEHLWRLLDGWKTSDTINLFMIRMGIIPVISYKREKDNRIHKAREMAKILRGGD